MKNFQGEWAVVTGAGSGIGRALACALARRGCNIYAVDRDAEALAGCREAVLQQADAEVVLHTVDLARLGAAEEVFDACAAIEVAVLVNDAGVFMYNDVIDAALGRVDEMLLLHVRTVAALCRLFGAQMAERRRGWILNMASYAVWLPLPGLSLYSATKSFIKKFSVAFAHEMQPYGVVVTAVSPAGVATDFYGLSRRLQRVGTRFGVLMSPEKIARRSLRALARRRRHIVPGWYHRLFVPLLALLPGWCVRLLHRKTARFRC